MTNKMYIKKIKSTLLFFFKDYGTIESEDFIFESELVRLMGTFFKNHNGLERVNPSICSAQYRIY